MARRFLVVSSLSFASLGILVLSSCREAILLPSEDNPPATEAPPGDGGGLTPVGVVEVTFTGIGAGGARTGATASVPENIASVFAAPQNADASGNGSIQLELASSGSFTEGTRGVDGQRYFFATFRVRNAQSDGTPYNTARQNLTFLAVQSTNSKPGTPIVTFERYDGSPADTAIAKAIVPTGSVTLDDSLKMKSTFADVVQVITEAEAGAVPRPAGVSDVFPYGFMVRNPSTSNSRTLPANPGPNQWDGLVTLAFRYPTQPSVAEDPFNVSVVFLVLDDSETRVTETIEEQDTAARNRVKARATALAATMVTVLDGSPSFGAGFYSATRQICAARTAGPSGSPISTINRPGAYTGIRLYYGAETLDACAPNFRSGTPSRPSIFVPFSMTARTMDRYGNVVTSIADTVTLTTTDVSATALSPAVAVSGGSAALTATYNTYGTFQNLLIGRRQRGAHPVLVHGATRMWTGDTSTDWFTQTNWSPVGGAPGAQDTALIPGDRPNYPLLVSNVTIGGTTMTPGTTAQPTINLSSFDYTLTASIDHGSTGTVLGTGRMFFTGVAQTISGGVANVDYRNARFTGTYSLNANLNVTGGRIVVQGGRLRNTGFRIRVRP